MMKRVLHLIACTLLLGPIGSVYAQQRGDCDASQCSSPCSARCCKPASQCKGFYFGVEATYLAPLYDESNASFAILDGGVLGAPTGLTSTIDTAEELTGAPRLTMGYMAPSGVGIQARYWKLTAFNNSNGVTDWLNPGAGNVIRLDGGTDSFSAYAIDLELAKECCYRSCNLLGTFGVRHANIDHSLVERASGTMNFDSYFMSASSSERFHGTGLTFSLSGLKSVNACKGLGVYTSARGSTLWGPAKSVANSNSSYFGAVGAATSQNGLVYSESNETMFIGEIGAGLQWSKCPQSLAGRLFARGGVEYQYWGVNDPTAISGSISSQLGNSAGVVLARAGDHETHLIGFSLMAGYAW